MRTDKIHVSHDATFQPLIFPVRELQGQLDNNWDLVEVEETMEARTDREDVDSDNLNKQRSDDYEERLPLVIPIRESENQQQETVDCPSTEQRQDNDESVKDENEEYDEELEIEIKPPQEPLQHSMRERNAPQWFMPGSNHLEEGGILRLSTTQMEQ
ncbi:hypothetical protein CROQUDRAFT_96595 [Cronartium quercuum f. sp. fusiforme G11]|uniref:Uncharacterized protein n=1 Tax=Cronartium quercuum f. sp. fusiforme G11 TaxID=708437 RepID=A0A9P6NAV5_9BASI|nr:hypothetical protein CROQUDRAFT_96595 [Cronartium quercuum f. sp. fusiforme G11]